MDSPAPHFTDTQIGNRWRASVLSGLGPLTAHGQSPEAAKAALEQMLGIARAIEVTRNRTR